MTTLSPSLLALAGFAGWTWALLMAIAMHRAWLVLRGQRRANAFSPWGDDVSAFSARLCRAHANCVENLPLFATLVLVAAFAGLGSLTDGLAPWALAARVAQSLIHLRSVSNRAVGLRFAFMAAQMGILGWWLWQLLGRAVAPAWSA